MISDWRRILTIAVLSSVASVPSLAPSTASAADVSGTTIETAVVHGFTVPEGKARITLRFSGGPTPLSARVFLFVMDEDGYDFWPRRPSDRWRKVYTQTVTIALKPNVTVGEQVICAGLYDKDGDGRRLRLKMGPGVHRCAFDDREAYEIGRLRVEPRQKLDP